MTRITLGRTESPAPQDLYGRLLLYPAGVLGEERAATANRRHRRALKLGNSNLPADVRTGWMPSRPSEWSLMSLNQNPDQMKCVTSRRAMCQGWWNLSGLVEEIVHERKTSVACLRTRSRTKAIDNAKAHYIVLKYLLLILRIWRVAPPDHNLMKSDRPLQAIWG